MKKQNRKSFISTIAFTFGGIALHATAPEKMNNKQLIHHVFFWLKNPGSNADLEKLLEGLRTLAKIETVKNIYIGVPADTQKRSVLNQVMLLPSFYFLMILQVRKLTRIIPFI